MRRYRIKAYRASGEWESFTIPSIFNAADVAAHMRHSVVCLYVPKGHDIYLENGGGGKATGPVWAIWDRKREGYSMAAQDVEAISPRSLYAASGL